MTHALIKQDVVRTGAAQLILKVCVSHPRLFFSLLSFKISTEKSCFFLLHSDCCVLYSVCCAIKHVSATFLLSNFHVDDDKRVNSTHSLVRD